MRLKGPTARVTTKTTIESASSVSSKCAILKEITVHEFYYAGVYEDTTTTRAAAGFRWRCIRRIITTGPTMSGIPLEMAVYNDSLKCTINVDAPPRSRRPQRGQCADG